MLSHSMQEEKKTNSGLDLNIVDQDPAGDAGLPKDLRKAVRRKRRDPRTGTKRQKERCAKYRENRVAGGLSPDARAGTEEHRQRMRQQRLDQKQKVAESDKSPEKRKDNRVGTAANNERLRKLREDKKAAGLPVDPRVGQSENATRLRDLRVQKQNMSQGASSSDVDAAENESAEDPDRSRSPRRH